MSLALTPRPLTGRGAGAGRTHDRWWAPWLFLAPALAIVITFILFPFVNTLALSVTDATCSDRGISSAWTTSPGSPRTSGSGSR